MSHKVSASAFIGDGVVLGENATIGPGAVILGPCVIEDDVWIGPGAQIGAPPEMTSSTQNAAWAGEPAHEGVRIRRGSVIRELAVIHQGTYRTTTVGEGCWILNRAYIAHDVVIDEGSTLSASVSVGGHCLIGPKVNVGMNASIHQRIVIGGGAMIGMATPVARDVPPFAKVFGSPARIRGLNRVGLSRLGVNEAEIELLSSNIRNDASPNGWWIESEHESLSVILSAWRSQSGLRPTRMALE